MAESSARKILVTGGAGFIGSHTCVGLMEHGYDVVIVDDHSNSSPVAIDRISQIVRRPPIACRVDITDRAALSEVFQRHRFDAVIHFAGKKAVGESADIPLQYFDVNIGGTSTLLRVMHDHDVHALVFSSSCSIYGDNLETPLGESATPQPTNPYAQSKLICEQLMATACTYHPELSITALRYFNPVGAHPSTLLGEDPTGPPNNIMPRLAQIAVGRLAELEVFGDDYPTPDGTAVRDYIHVLDVAEAHRVAVEHLGDRSGFRVFNLGTGEGVSVLDLVAAFQDASGQKIPYRIVGRRPGDVPCLIADTSLVAREWDWRTTRDLGQMCRDAWEFQTYNPAGYTVPAPNPVTA